ncbi:MULTISPECIES: ABC transporter permease [unclassified Bradyrhizobium]|uniref:ABC transporter permease n=1 Tax=Bradyrhizobium sp. USDA 4541 TaxID=2817704 RepID=UPI0020A4331F|nr:ABC transporter permease [Bradyrhizobium sp. USDA 4541]MCP1854544.1 ribose transport system permease protein [Bradyrhizobium sp. USDA 4541]
MSQAFVETTAPETPADPGIRRQKVVRLLVQFFGMGFFYLLIVVSLSFASPFFLTWSNAANVLTNVTVIGIVSLGQSLAIISGGFDLSVAGVLPLGSVLFALFSNAGMNVPAAIALVIIIGAVVGLINGLIVTKIRISPLIVTLGTLSITGGLAYAVTDGVTVPLANVEAGVLADPAFASVPAYVVAFVALALAGTFLLNFTVYGRMLYAVGGNSEASRLAGIRVDLVTISVYVLCGSLSAFAGVVVASQLLAGSATVGSDVALSSITAVVLGGASLSGGVGNIGGTLIGVLILGTVANGLALLHVPAFYQQIVTGTILLIGVSFARLREVLAREDS